jgi:hypothetical protein
MPRRWLPILNFALLVIAISAQYGVSYWRRISSHPQLKLVYLVPKDVTPRKDFPAAARRAAVAAQRWYFDELEHGVTFPVADGPVETIRTRHPEGWYRDAAGKKADREALWDTTMDEAFRLTGARYDDRKYLWVFFLDAALPAIPSQGTIGVTLFVRDDIVQLDGPEARCDAIGGVVHEIAHAVGVDHPAFCDATDADGSTPECASMSYLGYATFPRARFLPEERTRLLASPTFVALQPEAKQVDCWDVRPRH